MRNFFVLTDSLHFIELNLCEEISREEIAAYCHVSLSSLEKLFRYALHIGIKDYILRRRITQSAGDIVHTQLSLTQIAMKYQFNSPEVFCRAFKRIWNVSPSQFKSEWKFTGIYPKIDYHYQKGDDLEMARKNVDLSEAYDYFKAHTGSYVLCFDIQNLTSFNEISRRAGDLAILETARRLDQAAAGDMLVLRIGGDEFALITGSDSKKAAMDLRDAILLKNGQYVRFEEQDLPVSLWCGIIQIPDTLRYDSFFTEMHRSILDSKQKTG